MGKLRHEHGGVLALAAIIIPVFLLFTALVVDVGNWYTHKRQLQNRADAGAFAAGTAYAQNWRACVQSSDLALKTSAAREIANAARQYAGNPEATDYSPDPLPSTLFNNQIANQNNLDVVINSTSYTDDTDYSDGASGVPGDPCFVHAADDISAAGHWTDVKVKERDLPSLFGTFGLPLSQNGARARVEIRPALTGNKFLPLAVPDNVVTKVQVRYYDECRDPSHASPLATHDLKPLPAANQAAYAAGAGTTLWGLANGTPPAGNAGLSFGLDVPAYQASCGEYLPVGVEVRVASQDGVNLNASCTSLANSDFADCFTRISQFRVFNDGNPDSQPRITRVRITGGCGGLGGDAYFGVLPLGANTCPYGVTAEINWGTRDDGNRNIPANFTVTVNGAAMSLVTPTAEQSGTYSTAGTPLTAAAGATSITISLRWDDRDTTHSWQSQQCRRNGNNPCSYSASPITHRLVVGQDGDPSQATYTGVVELVRIGASAPGGNPLLPGSPLENHRSGGAGGGADCQNTNLCQIFPTVGIRSVLRAGAVTTLRLRESQGNQLLKCDPAYDNNGQEFSLFRYGCSPWYGANTYTDANWWGSFGQPTASCPPSNLWFGLGTMGAPYGLNSKTNPWKCVKASPGLSTPLIAEGLSVATDNCSRINNNSCQQTSCVVPGNYDGRAAGDGLPAMSDGWTKNSDSNDPRVINIFIIPYQALKTTRGGNSTQVVPVFGFASFYVMNWTGSNAQNSDPCPDRTFTTPTGTVTIPDPPAGAATGVFVETVDYEGGPVDYQTVCVIGQLTPCRAVLVR